MNDDYMLDNILDKIKAMINIEKFDDTKILIDTYDEFPGSITLKNVLILMKYDICLMVNFTHKYFQKYCFVKINIATTGAEKKCLKYWSQKKTE